MHYIVCALYALDSTPEIIKCKLSPQDTISCGDINPTLHSLSGSKAGKRSLKKIGSSPNGTNHAQFQGLLYEDQGIAGLDGARTPSTHPHELPLDPRTVAL